MSPAFVYAFEGSLFFGEDIIEVALYMLPKVTVHRILLRISLYITEKLGARNTPEYDLTDRFKLLAPKHGNMTFIPDWFVILSGCNITSS